MLYKIQETVFFRSDDGIVWLNDELRVSLTATTSRLLACLLEHKHQVVSKDEILEKVWDAYGLSTSSNSLYKYISDLRAVFRSLGRSEEIIITVPKIGFMISRDVLVETLGEANNVVGTREENEYETDDAPVLTAAANPTAGPPADVRPFWIRNLIYVAVAALIVIAGTVALWQTGTAGREHEEVFNLGNIDGCPVKSFSEQDPKKSLAILTAIMATQSMKCAQDSVYFVRFSVPVLNDKKGRVFVSQCRYAVGTRTKFSSCENYYRADYETAR